MKTIIIAASIILICSPLYARGFDVNRYCRDRAEEIGLGYSYEKTCREREMSAKREMSGRAIPGEIENYCADRADEVGLGYSYRWTCIKREMSAKKDLGY